MQYKIINEQPWQILSNAMTISPSETGYELQVAADGKNYTTLFSVGAGLTRQITNLSSGSYFRMKGNVGEVTVNWVRSCNSGGSGGGGNAGELEPVSEFPVGVPEGTVVALASGDTMGVYQYDGSEWIPVAGGDMSNYYTKSETDAEITAATATKQDTLVSGTNIKTINNESLLGSGNITIQGGGGDVVELTKAQYDALDPGPAADTTYIITDAETIDMDDYAMASGLTELSGTVQTLSTTVSNKADKQNVTARSAGDYLPGWNSQGVITAETRVYKKVLSINGSSTGSFFNTSNSNQPSIYAPTSAGTAGQPLLSNGSGAPVWGGYKFAFVSQSTYDGLATPDASTIYFIVDPN